MWKKILIGLVIFVALIFGLVLWLTCGMTKSANQFFSLIEQGEIEKAYQSTAEEFRARVSKEEFESFLSDTALIDFESAFWRSRKRSIGGKGELEGTIKTKTGGIIPIEIELVKEKGEWKISNIPKPKAGLITEEAKKKIPEEKELITITNNSMLLFAQAIDRDDFSEFYESISKLWQSQTDKNELSEAFKGFVERGIDFTVIKDKTPVFSEEPFIDEDGALTLIGYYPTEPHVIYFTLDYIFEYPDWQLFGIEVNI